MGATVCVTARKSFVLDVLRKALQLIHVDWETVTLQVMVRERSGKTSKRFNGALTFSANVLHRDMLVCLVVGRSAQPCRVLSVFAMLLQNNH